MKNELHLSSIIIILGQVLLIMNFISFAHHLDDIFEIVNTDLFQHFCFYLWWFWLKVTFFQQKSQRIHPIDLTKLLSISDDNFKPILQIVVFSQMSKNIFPKHCFLCGISCLVCFDFRFIKQTICRQRNHGKE